MANLFDDPISKKNAGNIFDVPKVSSKKVDLSTLEGLTQKANELGYQSDVEKIIPEPKLSSLQRLGKGLGAFNPAEAVLTGMEEGVGAGILEYGKDIATGIGSAVTGKDFEEERRTFSDVAEKMGIENKIAKFGIGFLGDVFLDPSTYFGGALIKGLSAVAKGGTNIALKGIGKLAPEVEAGTRLIGTGLQDAVGRAVQYGYKATKGAREDVLSFLTKTQKAKLGLAASNLDRLGTGTLSKAQQEEMALRLIAGKRAEFGARELADSIDVSKPLYHAGGGASEMQNGITILTPEQKLKYPTSGGGYVGLSTTNDLNYAKMISNTVTGADSNVVEMYLKKSAKVFDVGEKHIDDLTGKEIEELSKKYDVLKSSQEGEYRILNSDVVKTKTQVDAMIKRSGEAAREATFKDVSPETARLIEQQIERTKKFAMGITDNPYETYFPFIKKDSVEKFLNETTGIKIGSEGYRKKFRNLLTNENMELDPAKAFFTREAQVVSDKMTADFLDGFVKKYGKPLSEFDSTDDAIKSGYQLIKDKGMFGKELGFVNKYDADLIRNSLNADYPVINMLAKATGFDAVTSLFKRSVTGLFVPFHVRNFMSGIIQNYEALGAAALNPMNMNVGRKIAYMLAKNEKFPNELIEIGGKKIKLSQLIKPFANRFSGDTFYNNDFLQAIEKGAELKQVQGAFSKGALKETLKTAGLGTEGTPFKIARAVGQFIEHQQKATAYVTAVSQGKTIPEALSLAEKAGFDYRALTKFESQIMRRIIPFYSFTRKNIELQLKTLGENPQRINQILAFFNNLGEPISPEEKGGLPDFIRESIGVKLEDTPDGLKQYISSFGTPIEAFTQLFGSNPVLRAISMMNPILKAPIEIGIGKDSFRQKDLQEVYTANEYKKAPQVIKDLLDIHEVQKDILAKNSKGKLVKVGERTEYQADPVRLLIARSLFTSRGVSYLDQVFGGDLKGVVKLLKTTTGFKPQQVNLETVKAVKEKEQKRALEDLLTKRGDVRQYKSVYEPK